MIDLVIFDFDGTLVDTAPDLIRSVNLYLESKGFDALPAWSIRREIGMGMKKLILSFFPDKGDDENFHRKVEGEFIAVYEREYLHSPRLYDGVHEFMAEWDGQIAIVSNKRRRFITPILEHLEADRFPWVTIVGGDTYQHMKPHPLPILSAIAQAGTTPERTLIVGDGAPDVMGALAVGSRCVAVEFGYTPVADLINLGAWKSIEGFPNLLPLIRSLT